MKRRPVALAGIASAVTLAAASGSLAGTAPPSPPLLSHHTHCTTDVQSGTPLSTWTEVDMLIPGAGDTFWIGSPPGLAGHYLIKSYRYIDGDPSTVPDYKDPNWSQWTTKGAKTGPTQKSQTIECEGSFSDAAHPYWVDSIDVLLPSGT